MTTDAELDALLRADAQTVPADEGFTARVMARLPAQSLNRSSTRSSIHRRRPSRPPAQIAQRAVLLSALTAALFAFGLLWPTGAGALPQGPEQSLAALALLALCVWWCLPQSGGRAWR